MTKFGFRIRTRGGLVVDSLVVTARDRTEAEHKLTQIYHRCEILECQEIQPTPKDEGMSFDSAISLINRQTDPGVPPDKPG